jgi:hypothetical protein
MQINQNTPTIRKLKIYDLLKIGDSDIIELYNYLDISFNNLSIRKNLFEFENESIYYKNNLAIFKINHKNNNVYVNYYSVWNHIQYTLLNNRFEDVQNIIYYILNVKYNLEPSYIGYDNNLH